MLQTVKCSVCGADCCESSDLENTGFKNLCYECYKKRICNKHVGKHEVRNKIISAIIGKEIKEEKIYPEFI